MNPETKGENWIVIPGRAEGPTWESAGRVVRLRPLIGLPRRHAPRNDGRGGGQATESVCPDEAFLNLKKLRIFGNLSSEMFCLALNGGGFILRTLNYSILLK